MRYFNLFSQIFVGVVPKLAPGAFLQKTTDFMLFGLSIVVAVAVAVVVVVVEGQGGILP